MSFFLAFLPPRVGVLQSLELLEPVLMETTRASLLLRIRDRGDSAAWAEFDAIYRPILTRLCMARGFDRSGTDDIVQQCMLTVHRHIGGFEYDQAKGRFKSWLRTMAINQMKNQWRGQQEVQGGTSLGVGEAASIESPEQAFDKIWMEEHLSYCLQAIRNEIEPHAYEAFRLYALEERSPEEVCAQVGMEPAQLYRLKYKVTQRLADKMRELLGDEELEAE